MTLLAIVSDSSVRRLHALMSASSQLYGRTLDVGCHGLLCNISRVWWQFLLLYSICDSQVSDIRDTNHLGSETSHGAASKQIDGWGTYGFNKLNNIFYKARKLCS